ncbi:MAG: hypothetical protein ACHREM_23270 [Polyangiales bacterium]
MSNKTPVQQVKDTFGDKAGLVKAIEALTGDSLWLARTNADKGLGHVSNAKLLKLHATFTAVKAKFTTRDALIDAVVAAENRSKDATYKASLGTWPVPRLFDLYQSLTKRAAAKKAAETKPAKKAVAAPAKPAKKTAGKHGERAVAPKLSKKDAAAAKAATKK